MTRFSFHFILRSNTSPWTHRENANRISLFHFISLLINHLVLSFLYLSFLHISKFRKYRQSESLRTEHFVMKYSIHHSPQNGQCLLRCSYHSKYHLNMVSFPYLKSLHLQSKSTVYSSSDTIPHSIHVEALSSCY